jgi:predicted metal-dependent HD superfamily phosphohydrolase
VQHHLTKLAADHVRTIFQDRLTTAYSYHNWDHTLAVVAEAKIIGERCGLSEEDMLAVELAAWFHDAGVTETYIHHEARSAELAAAFLREYGYPSDRIEVVRYCILATDLTTSPRTLAEQVLCDADMVHLASEEFWEHADALRGEWQVLLGHTYTDEQWMSKQIDFMKARQFHTEAAREYHEEGLARNIRKLEKKFRKRYGGDDLKEPNEPNEKKKKSIRTSENENAVTEKDKKSDKVKDDFLGRGDRGVETMFRTTSRNHVEFSSMVDSKANIMISINALVISVVISVLFRKLDSNPYMTIPTFIFLGVCLTTIVYAVLASRPKVTSGIFTRDDITHKRANLLFFGNFHKMSLEDYEWGMKEMLKDKEYLYGSMIRDFYYLGSVLGKKYQYLRISYNVFMYGFVASIIIYVLMFLITSQNPIDMLPW